MAYKKPGRGQVPKHRGFGIGLLQLRWLTLCNLTVSAAALVEEHVADLQIFDHIARHSADVST